ncbi:hypothetical protein [Nocardia sp.]|uniref:hypothetical protein n=1 Tax=Nocardia sp. TaxID=1821 RepID=UPI0026119450|nr:hypothetical protein [Nocardia sp.]
MRYSEFDEIRAECIIMSITPSGKITLSNGEFFGPAHLIPGRRDSATYFKKHDRKTGVTKTARKPTT